MAEHSNDLTKSAKASTGKTERVTQEEALEILQASLKMCQDAGINIQVIPKFYANGDHYAALLLANTEFINGNLALITGK